MSEITTILNPSFDPLEKIWFLEDGSWAPSLRELQAQFPDAVIENYYPEGYGLKVPPRPAHVVKAVDTRSRPRFKPEIAEALDEEEIPKFLPRRDPEQTPEPAVEEEAPAPEPEPEFQSGPPPRVREQSKIRQKRLRRASAFERIDWSNPETVEKLRLLVLAGLTGDEIGRVMKCSRNAIIGACHRKGFQLQG